MDGERIVSAGFYKIADGDLLYAPTVTGPGFRLDEDNRKPTDGWAWFESAEEAILGCNEVSIIPLSDIIATIESMDAVLALVTAEILGGS